jgi:MtN3 and saliva related transmembrane protein
MHNIWVEVVGYVAAFFGTILMLPQTYKSYKTKKVDDISMSMLVVYIINCTLWEIYGLFIASNPIIVCNLIALCIGSLQIVIKVRYGTSKLH